MSKSHRKLSKYGFLKENFVRWWTVLNGFNGSSARNLKRVSFLDMSQSVPHRTRLHGKILAITSFPAPPRPPHRPPPHQAQSPISTPIPHNLKYRFWSLISLSVAVVRRHSGNCGQMVNIRGILIEILILVGWILSELYKLAKEREHHDHDYATLPVSADTSLFIPNYIVM